MSEIRSAPVASGRRRWSGVTIIAECSFASSIVLRALSERRGFESSSYCIERDWDCL